MVRQIISIVWHQSAWDSRSKSVERASQLIRVTSMKVEMQEGVQNRSRCFGRLVHIAGLRNCLITNGSAATVLVVCSMRIVPLTEVY